MAATYLLPASLLLLFLASSCGDNGNDTIWTGFSGFVILVVVVWGIFRLRRK